ncbi:MAG: secondary thiamine-phosphate synthase enzyme YjbQ [archaeon]|nr:secondary thiamine-phosphate synthase enzyme YjbQ [archaeon]
MKSIIFELNFATTKPVQFFDVTERVQEKVKESKIQEGLAVVFTHHTTCCVKINEKEKNLENDMTRFLDEVVPRSRYSGSYAHDDTAAEGRVNAHSHLKSLILNTSEVIPVHAGELLLGTWQSIFFVELDGDRKRKLFIQVIGE